MTAVYSNNTAREKTFDVTEMDNTNVERRKLHLILYEFRMGLAVTKTANNICITVSKYVLSIGTI